jgi:putative transposase
MPQSLVQIYLHIVFSTKRRKPFLQNNEIREKTYAYMAGICKKLECPAIIVGGTEDHVHIFNRLSKNITVANFLRELKRSSSGWIKTLSSTLSSFYWQNGYGAFSVSPKHTDNIKNYILEQAGHHHHESFQDEFRRLCRIYDVEIDERYVWD